MAKLDVPPDMAMIIVVPAATAAARPLESIVATSGADEVQVTDVVRFCVALFE